MAFVCHGLLFSLEFLLSILLFLLSGFVFSCSISLVLVMERKLKHIHSLNWLGKWDWSTSTTHSFRRRDIASHTGAWRKFCSAFFLSYILLSSVVFDELMRYEKLLFCNNNLSGLCTTTTTMSGMDGFWEREKKGRCLTERWREENWNFYEVKLLLCFAVDMSDA